MTKGIGGHTYPGHGATDEWLTPPDILKALGPFDLDPCASVIRPWPMAAEHYTIKDNGLLKIWRGRVWMNPPYGEQLGRWLGRMAEHGDGIALTFARTETEAFFQHVWPVATGLMFIKGRLHFHYVDGTRAPANSGGPSVLIAYGRGCAQVLRESRLPGKYVELNAA